MVKVSWACSGRNNILNPFMLICFKAFSYQLDLLHIKFFLFTCRGIAVGHTPGVLTDATVSKP